MIDNMKLKSALGIPAEGMPTGQPMPNGAPSGMGSAVVDSQKAGMTDYGARLASRAKPDMDSR